MAGNDQASSKTPLRTTSYETALCIIPPSSRCNHIEQLRELYDKAYGIWPPHLNLIYPFVSPESLPQAQQKIQEYFAEHLQPTAPITVRLDQAGLFKQRKISTVFLGERRTEISTLASIRHMALQALDNKPTASNLHLTVGQAEDHTLFSQQFLLSKAQLLPTLQIQIGALAILVRERSTATNAIPRMRLWGSINLPPKTLARTTPPITEFWLRQAIIPIDIAGVEEIDSDEQGHLENITPTRSTYNGMAWSYDLDSDLWVPCPGVEEIDIGTDDVTIASYNVLVDSEYPPVRDRDPLLVRTILSDAAMASVLVLQEVSDDFLTYLLGDSEVQRRYPFTSHGPPSQPDVAPLPSLRNIVVLSRWPFSWKSLPFHRR